MFEQTPTDSCAGNCELGHVCKKLRHSTEFRQLYAELLSTRRESCYCVSLVSSLATDTILVRIILVRAWLGRARFM